MRKSFVSCKMVVGFLAGLAIASMVGCASRPPTKTELKFFDVQTNLAPVISVQTNVIPVTIYRTNEQNVVIPVTLYETNVVPVTNYTEAYVYKPGAGAAEAAQVGGAVGNLFGAGGIASTGIMALFSLWGYLRSRKSLVTAGNIAQTVETIREFVKTLPNGTVYDNELVNWMQQHQAEQGVLNQVLDLLNKQVSNADARVAADQIRATITALGKTP